MKFHRINALLIRHLYLYKRSLPRLMDIFFWPMMELFVWGFLSLYLEKLDLGVPNIVTVLLGAIIFWDLLSQSQRAVSIAFLEDVWERNILNIFVTPLKIGEYIASGMLVGVVRVLMVIVVMGLLALGLYSANIFAFGFYLIPFMLNLIIFGWSLGLFTTAIILRYGTSAQVLAFGFIFLIQPFSAVFYPVSALPVWAGHIAWFLPSTYVFEGMRGVLSAGNFSFSLFSLGLLANLIYLGAVLVFFYQMFARVKVKGLLLKLD